MIMSGKIEEFCGSKFWDINETWYTDDPDFTPCFEQTVLVWIPAGFLWTFGIMEALHGCWKRTRRRRMSFLYAFQQCVVLVIGILEGLQFLNSFRPVNQDDSIKIYPVEHVSPGLKSVTFVLAFLLQLRNRSKVVRNSGVVFTFWLLAVLCGAFEFRSALRNLPQHPSIAKDDARKITEIITYPFIILEFLLHFFPDSKRTSQSQYEQLSEEPESSRVPCPEMLASFPSKLTFQWVWPLVKLGCKKPLELPDVWNLNAEDKSKHLTNQFNAIWKPVLRRCKEWNTQERRKIAEQTARLSNGNEDNIQLISDEKKIKSKTANFLWTVTKANFWYFLWGSSMKLFYDLLLFVSPQLLDLLIRHVNSDEEPWKGYMYAFALFVFSITGTISLGQYFQRMMVTAMRVRSALVGAIYEKALIVSNAARKESTTGEIVNLMSVDAQRIVDILPYINGVWSSPLQIALALYFLYQTLGLAVFAGVGTMVLLVPVNIVVAKKVEKLEVKQMEFKDQRVKLINEILSGIKVLKLYAWEPSFEKQVNEIRAKELHILKISSYIDAFNEFVWYTAPFLVSLATFGTYVLINEDNVLDARKAFVALSLFNILRMPLSMMPYILVFAVQAGVSVKRINKFLNAEEIDPQDISHVEPRDGSAITIENGDFRWDDKQGATLQNVNFKVPKGAFVAVVGAVGSGKSSLLSAVLGEIQKIRGTVNTVGSIAYVAQQAWIQNATLKDNVLFGREYIDEAYDSVIESCALVPDLEILPAGDQTEIGEKGINLSGGQKQRVSLARATYSNADVFLLDDPLSAVDAHVGKHLFEKVIGPEGVLKNKTRVMVTHSVTYLPNVDHIVVMSKGEISESGTFHELMQKKGAFSEFLTQYARTEDLEALGVSASEKGVKSDQAERRQSESDGQEKKDDKKKDSDRLIEEEKAETGSVNRSVYFHYLKSIGWDIGIVTLVFHLVAHGLTMYSNIWLSKWSSETPSMNKTEDVAKRDLYLGVYGGLGLGQAISIFVATLSMSLGSIRAARYLHTKMLTHILRSPMSFFDTTPLGRIVNRFSKDINSVDYTFPTTLRTFMNCVLEVFFTLVVISYSTPIFLLAIAPIAVLYLFIQRFYVITSRQLKRLDSVSRSPIYSHFSETLTGTATIRAFKSQERFVGKSFKAVDDNQMAYFASVMSNRWLAVRLEGLGNVIGFLSALFAVYAHPTPGIVGLSVSYSFNITDALNWLVRMSSQVETDVVAVERIKEYGETPQEAEWDIPEKKPPTSWPTEGTIDFKNYQTRYREGLDLVLKHVSFHINSGEKVGIVGRTGAGKSSMTLSLFRLIEGAGGSIEIDGVNISSVGLHDLRGRLTIIPQDPVLFSGTMRLNLDPFGKYTDDEVWCALDYAHLKEYVSSLESGLEYEVSEGGENLSVGQRQLVCLARALLRKSKVLVLDEATAAVDLETDDLIQQTIRNKFKDCTILTIAHRLNTIMDYDRILVLDKGEVREFDSPGNLLKDQNSIFFSMVKDNGLA